MIQLSRTLYLHIGSHKTGTTSIQQFLRSQRRVLRARGIHYPTSDNNLNLGGVLGKPDADMPSPRRIAEIMEMLTPRKSPVVIASTEGFSYLASRAMIAAYHERLAAQFSDIKIICYLRRQDQLAISHHQEGANAQSKPAVRLHGHRPFALPEQCELQRKYLDYETRIGHWADLFGDDAMIVRVYDRTLLKGGDVLADFLDIVGLSDIYQADAPERNVSMGIIQTKVGHIISDIVSDQHVRQTVLKHLPESPRMLPRRADAEVFVAPFVEGNQRLNARLKINDVRALFSDDFTMYPLEGHEQWGEATADAAIRACAKLIELLSARSVELSPEDYTEAAAAVQTTNPALSARMLDAAHKLNPQSERIRLKVPNPSGREPAKRRRRLETTN